MKLSAITDSGVTTKTFALRSQQVRSRAAEFILNLPDKPVYEARIGLHKKSRSTQANAYYWGVVVTAMADHLGYTKSEMHTILCGECFGWKSVAFKGRNVEVPNRTSTTPDKLSTTDFHGLIMLGQRIAAENGVRLPDMYEPEQA